MSVGQQCFCDCVGSHFPWFSGIQGIAIACLGFGFGLAWEDWVTRDVGTKIEPVRETKPFTAAVATMLAGGTWGLLSSSSAHTFVTGLLVLAVALWRWVSYVGKSKSAAGKNNFLLISGLAVVAYMVAAASFNFAS